MGFGQKKAGSRKTACSDKNGDGLDVGLGLAEALNAIAGFPLAALFEEVDAFETLQNVTLNNETGGALEAFVL
jgi:hypothetical protein